MPRILEYANLVHWKTIYIQHTQTFVRNVIYMNIRSTFCYNLSNASNIDLKDLHFRPTGPHSAKTGICCSVSKH